MKIRQDQPQFEGRKSLILVSGESKAKYYMAFNGQVSLLDEFAVVDPRTELREDYMETTRTSISGSFPEGMKRSMREKLLKRVEKETKKLFEDNKIVDLYIFCIESMINEVKNVLPTQIRDSIRFEKKGDMQYHHPVELLEFIKKAMDDKASLGEVLSPEEIKIRGMSQEK